MAFMAAYNIDRFRDFVFQSSFLKALSHQKSAGQKTSGQRPGTAVVRFRMDSLFRLGDSVHPGLRTGRPS
jgi:hypothetical protein